MDGRIACKKDLPPGPWTVEVIQMIVKARVAEIRANMKERSERVSTGSILSISRNPKLDGYGTRGSASR